MLKCIVVWVLECVWCCWLLITMVAQHNGCSAQWSLSTMVAQHDGRFKLIAWWLLSMMVTQHDICSAQWLLSMMYVMLCVMVCMMFCVMLSCCLVMICVWSHVWCHVCSHVWCHVWCLCVVLLCSDVVSCWYGGMNDFRLFGHFDDWWTDGRTEHLYFLSLDWKDRRQ